MSYLYKWTSSNNKLRDEYVCAGVKANQQFGEVCEAPAKNTSGGIGVRAPTAASSTASTRRGERN